MMTKLAQILFAVAVIVLVLWIVGQLTQDVAGGLMTVLEFVG